MKKITYIQLDSGLSKSLSSLHKVARKEDVIKVFTVTSDMGEAKTLNEAIASIKDIEDTLVCIVPKEAELREDFASFVSLYVEETDNKVFTPMVELVEKKDDKLEFKGFLNSVIWKSYVVDSVGSLDHDAAMKQIDMTLAFALIDGKLLKETLFDESIPFFYHYKWLNEVTSHEHVEVLGIPKVVGNIIESKEYKETTQEQKVEWFKSAQNYVKLADTLSVVDNG